MFVPRMAAVLLASVTVAAMGVAVSAPGEAAAATCTGKARSDFNGDGISDVAVGERGANGGKGAVHILYGTRSGLRAAPTATTPDDQIINSPALGDAGFGSAVVALDFDGNGCSDLAVGAPRGTRPGAAASQTGFVSVYLGSVNGLNTSAPLNLDGSTAGHVPDFGDLFGSSLATGNFNGDTKQDLIIGAPREDGTNGAVYIVPGATSHGSRFTQGSDGVPAGDGGDELGSSVAAADFNGDHVDDLAAGAPDRHQTAGGVMVMNGSGNSSLLSSSGAKLWSQDTADSAGRGISGNSEPGDEFGASLATDDFNGDGRADLAVGVPLEDLGSAADAGMVNVIYSAGTSGLGVAGNQGWSQNSAGITGAAETSDEFGASLVAGDFNGDDRADLAVGVPFEDLGSAADAGTVNVLMGSSAGLSSSGQQSWSQASAGITGSPETGDGFGNSLVAVRTHSAARDDLVVGASGEAIGTVKNAGMIHMIPGSSKRLTASGSQGFNAGTAGVQGTATANGRFGVAVS